MNSILKVNLNLLNLSKKIQCQRGLWWWTVLMFNRMDLERTKALGYDRTAAEWLLRNGACAKFVGSPHLHCDYNLLPPENSKFFVKEIQAGENAGINADGFAHIKGCEKLDRIALNNCSYITDEALEKLALRKDTLKVLEITDCKNITDEGLRYLKDLSNLEKLILRDLPYVKNPEKITSELKAKLVNCDIDFK